jgi:hypothetical protein
VLQPVARSVSSVLSQQIFQNYIVQHRVCQQTLQFAVLIFKRFKAVGVRNVHATVFGFELVERRGTEAMPAAHLSSLDLSRFRAAPGARLSHLSFEGDRAFPAQC